MDTSMPTMCQALSLVFQHSQFHLLPSFNAHLITYETDSASASYEARAQRRGVFSLGVEGARV